MSNFLPFSRPAMGAEELAAVKEVLESDGLLPGRKIWHWKMPLFS